MRKCLFLLFFCLSVVTRGQTMVDYDTSGLFSSVKAQALRYWFDGSTDNIRTNNNVSSVQEIDVSILDNGIHTLHCQVVGNDGIAYGVSSASFLKIGNIYDENVTGVATKVLELRYWFDNDTDNIQTSNILSGVQDIDVSTLGDGMHTLHYQIVGADNRVYGIASETFLKLGMSIEEPVVGNSIAAAKLNYWFDNDIDNIRTNNILTGLQTLDVSKLDDGIHVLHYQIIGEDSCVYGLASGLFLKNYEMAIEKTPNKISKYQYWLNDNSHGLKTVTLNEAESTYSLTALLPIQKVPIRSSAFLFDVVDGVPTIYAKNDLHIRFHDTKGHFVDGSQPYVDYSVKQEVTDFMQLESNVRQTVDKPESNIIKWYKVVAEPGDSLQFKLNRAATVHLFSPSGEEVYNASGLESVQWGGCHAWEDGTYYLAMHDVMSMQGGTISIDYNHIDKYAVLRQDVSVVGNGGCSTITFEGNGFRDLYAVDLYNEQGDTIKHIYIGHESDAKTSVVFDFTEASLSIYNAIFHFATEDKELPHLVTVEEARDIELATTVTYPSRFLRGTPTMYTIHVTNKGNMTAYNVPIEMLVLSPDYSDISEIRFDGDIKNMPLPSIFETDSIDEDIKEILMESYRNGKGLSQFVVYHDSLDQKDTAISYVILSIPPRTSRTISVSVTSTSSVTIEAYTNNDWYPIRSNGFSNNQTLRETLCCMRNKVECVANIATKFVPPGVSCGFSLGVTGLETLYDVWCSAGSNMSERFGNYVKSEGYNLINNIIGVAIDCITAHMGTQYKDLRERRAEAYILGNEAAAANITAQMKSLREVLYGNLNIAYQGLSTFLLGKDCYEAFFKSVPKCPPNPIGGGGISYAVSSFDPNEIYGYTAESGCRAVGIDHSDVWYAIQFENDTAFATAAAHDVYLTDTLDASKFDLLTFEPTRIKIGEKTAELAGEKNFVTTIDMRPEIYAVAQVEGTYDEKTGIARWHISSLDPMTMEPATGISQGVLPVNIDGSGMGEISFNISIKDGLAQGTEIPNRAAIVFDSNDVIMTPTWTNTIDRIAPVSHVKDVEVLNDSTAAVGIEANDELSGPWRYNVYVQYGSGAWFLGAENVPVDSIAKVQVYAGIKHDFYVVATDSAGNVEQKEAEREFSLTFYTDLRGDVNSDGDVDIADAVCIVNHVVGKATPVFNEQAADVNADGDVDIADAVRIVNLVVGKISSLARQLHMQNDMREPE